MGHACQMSVWAARNYRPEHYISVGLPEFVVSKMSAQDCTKTKDTAIPRIEIKIPDLAGNRTRVARLEGRDPTVHATVTYPVFKHQNTDIRNSCHMYVSHFYPKNEKSWQHPHHSLHNKILARLQGVHPVLEGDPDKRNVIM